MAYALVTQARAAAKQRTATVARRAARLGRPTPGIRARASTGVVYRTPVYGYTGLAGYNAAGPGDVQTHQQALGFNLFKVVSAPFRFAAKGVKAGVKFVVKHPLDVAGVVAGGGLTFLAARRGLKLLRGRHATRPAVAPRVDLAPSVVAEPSTAPKTLAEAVGISQPTGSRSDPYNTGVPWWKQIQATNVPDVTGPTWTDALKTGLKEVGQDTLAKFKRNAIHTILAQPGVRDVAERVAGEVVSAQAGEAAAAVPSWVLPVAIGGGALLIGTMLGGRRAPEGRGR